jgi:hypothetical protein
MFRKWLAAIALLGLCSLFFVAQASAQVYTYERLRSLLITQDDISNTGLQFGSDDQKDLGGGVIQVLRYFTGDVPGGTAVGAVSLIGATDGSTPPGDVRNQVLSGDLIQAMATGTGATIGSFSLAGSQGIGDVDQSAQFDGILNGVTYRFYGDSFVSGNLVGLILYGAPIDQASSDVASTILHAQDYKLP